MAISERDPAGAAGDEKPDTQPSTEPTGDEPTGEGDET